MAKHQDTQVILEYTRPHTFATLLSGLFYKHSHDHWWQHSPRMVYNAHQMKYCGNIDQLATWAIAMKCVLPQTLVWTDNPFIYQCVVTLRDVLMEYCNTVTESRPCNYEYNTLPFELWDIVYKQLDCKDRVALGSTCTVLHQIHKTLFGNVDHMTMFIKNNSKMLPRDCYGFISVSRARSYYMLSLKELKDVPGNVMWNKRKEYTTTNIAKAVCTKYGTIEKFLEEKDRRLKRSEEMYKKRNFVRTLIADRT